MMTKKQAADINQIFRTNKEYISKLKLEIDSLKKPVPFYTPPKIVKGILVVHDTVTVIDTLRRVDTIKNTVTVTDTIGPRLRGSVLLPKGDFWLYTYNEKNQRYELDPNTLNAVKENNKDRLGTNLMLIWSTTVIILTSIIFFTGA